MLASFLLKTLALTGGNIGPEGSVVRYFSRFADVFARKLRRASEILLEMASHSVPSRVDIKGLWVGGWGGGPGGGPSYIAGARLCVSVSISDGGFFLSPFACEDTRIPIADSASCVILLTVLALQPSNWATASLIGPPL